MRQFWESFATLDEARREYWIVRLNIDRTRIASIRSSTGLPEGGSP